jgi:hypothetical protein
MAHCNSCGRFMKPTENVYKRQMYSGRSNRTYYGKRINFSSASYYSVKNVCYDCAKAIDEQSNQSAKTFIIVAFIIVIIGSLYYLFIKQ